MEDSKTVEKASKEKTSATVKRKNVLKKLDLESAKLLASIKDKANKKNYGRKIKDAEIIAKALGLIESQHIQELQETTLSEKDRLHIAHDDFQKKNGKITLDQFIGKLLKGQINQQQAAAI